MLLPMDYLALLHRYYPEDNALRRMLLHHSRQVCARALQIVERHPELGAVGKCACIAHRDGGVAGDGVAQAVEVEFYVATRAVDVFCLWGGSVGGGG